MTSTDGLDPLTFAGSFAYLESDVPPGLTLPACSTTRRSCRQTGPAYAPSCS